MEEEELFFKRFSEEKQEQIRGLLYKNNRQL